MLGFRKNLLTIPQTCDSTAHGDLIEGITHAERTLVTMPKARDLLLKFSGYSKDRKRLARPRELSHVEFRQLCQSLRKDGFRVLADLIERLELESGRKVAPNPYREFLSELARNSPACGTVQVAGNNDALKALRLLARGSVNIFSSRNHRYLSIVQQSAPIVASFLSTCPKGPGGTIPQDVQEVLSYMLTKIEAPFSHPPPSAEHYPPPNPANKFSYFPNLPQHHGSAVYKADKTAAPKPTHTHKGFESDGCRKHSYGHPTLSPGIFTIHCPHGVCYGFEVLRSCEFPRHPFEIFKTHFREAPQEIVYDNSCRLHLYCLNREPAFFKNSRFYVDRFHWRGHIGCSSGYSLDQYKTMNDINSQVNEQANAGIKRIRGQLAYMTVDNFVFHLALFLAIKNLDTKAKIDIGCLHI